MKNILLIMFIVICVSLFGCEEKKGAVSDSKAFLEQFNTATKNYKEEPTKENLKVILDLVKKTDIKLNDDEKKVVDIGMQELAKKVEDSGADIKKLWESNKEAVMGVLQDGKNRFIDKINTMLKKDK